MSECGSLLCLKFGTSEGSGGGGVLWETTTY